MNTPTAVHPRPSHTTPGWGTRLAATAANEATINAQAAIAETTTRWPSAE